MRTIMHLNEKKSITIKYSKHSWRIIVLLFIHECSRGSNRFSLSVLYYLNLVHMKEIFYINLILVNRRMAMKFKKKNIQTQSFSQLHSILFLQL